MSFATAQERCGGEDSLCRRDRRPSCEEDDENIGTRCYDNNYFWTANSCTLQAKIEANGKVGIVHRPPDVLLNETAFIVHADTRTFFRVDWEGDFREIVAACGTVGSCVQTEDGACLCEVTVVQRQVFDGANLPTAEDILSQLHVGAHEQHGQTMASSSSNGVNAYNLGPDGLLLPESIFELVDNHGRRHLRKNSKSNVVIAGSDISFRNPVHFISLSDSEPRDAHHETDATLDQYIYHGNTAPFLAMRFAQRFGISNPSPRFIEEISTSFVKGEYSFEDDNGNNIKFGSGKYADLAATFACVLLDRESRDVLLDNDPTHGALKEPLIKVLGLMRALKFMPRDDHPFVQFDRSFGDRIGQMAHELPSVFSFFRPEYQPAGKAGFSLIRAASLALFLLTFDWQR